MLRSKQQLTSQFLLCHCMKKYGRNSQLHLLPFFLNVKAVVVDCKCSSSRASAVGVLFVLKYYRIGYQNW